MRIGHGFDVHAFGGTKKTLILCGVTIPYTKGLVAHSDGDVCLHALTDALLGAAALGDMGQLFPDTDPTYKDVSSRVLLRKVIHTISEKKYSVNNIDMTIIAQKPRILPYTMQMRINVSKDLGINIDNVNVKATTTDHLGFIGHNEGIACEAVVLLTRV
ncbi:2-C-methyl-D-erythritol 2,4-cyclodiphosphate synthase [Candidatus Erwinia haradaeae]|uniref:2-C-methyl-D-erythritol 2,4-cyclodiphosphate synthase n=1 Tax=Candidatus Erwinia haradaeae TaxID=1922217 RepID=A0A451DDM8_9GAMM|nr:2-C-methyl-D-erythritol 2,4-cyclodiphosphate synthase [Candidatus Erwinia haradaeae]VFP84539.1 2-C-methyl-D-erythritol 2,4-cyclodiphosphate synthase [Candidatus Erwinia haradaeae]